MTSSALAGLKPETLWKYFDLICQIPHGSNNEAALAKAVIELARSKGYDVAQDKTGNVVIRVPASPGKQAAPGVVLQGHLDMVCEKNSNTQHNFEQDPIRLVRQGEYLTADGTTLGSDNGIGLAAALALAEDPDSVHGPLEILCTVAEEVGLDGARALTAELLRGRIMLNLDSEEEGAIYVGCAGGTDTTAILPVKRSPSVGQPFRVQVSGLKGGHSGLDINTGRGNAIQVLAWYLDKLRGEVDFKLVSFEGGNKHNAIPREAWATLFLTKTSQAVAERVLETFRKDMAHVYGKTDGGIAIELSETQTHLLPLAKKDRDKFLNLVLALPHGVLAMSQAIPGLVESSTNLAVVRLEETQAFLHESSRSSVMPALDRIQAGLFAITQLAGADPTNKGGYPGWQPNMDSVILARARRVHTQLFGKEAQVKAIHAGLECGIIGEKVGGMDMISFGPQIEWPHSPSERVKVDTVEHFYSFLKTLVKDIAD